MPKKPFENNNFILYAPDSLNYITNDIEIILNESLELYKGIFDIDNFRKVQINYFDDIEEFRKLLYDYDKIIKYGETVLNDAINYYKGE